MFQQKKWNFKHTIGLFNAIFHRVKLDTEGWISPSQVPSSNHKLLMCSWYVQYHWNSLYNPVHTLKQSLEYTFSQGNAYRTQFLKTEMYSITGFWITSYWVLVLSWWESFAWDFLVHLTRSSYDCKGKGTHTSTLQRMSLLPRKTVIIPIDPRQKKA